MKWVTHSRVVRDFANVYSIVKFIVCTQCRDVYLYSHMQFYILCMIWFGNAMTIYGIIIIIFSGINSF